jgi:hypothetical protein
MYSIDNVCLVYIAYQIGTHGCVRADTGREDTAGASGMWRLAAQSSERD